MEQPYKHHEKALPNPVQPPARAPAAAHTRRSNCSRPQPHFCGQLENNKPYRGMNHGARRLGAVLKCSQVCQLRHKSKPPLRRALRTPPPEAANLDEGAARSRAAAFQPAAPRPVPHSSRCCAGPLSHGYCARKGHGGKTTSLQSQDGRPRSGQPPTSRRSATTSRRRRRRSTCSSSSCSSPVIASSCLRNRHHHLCTRIVPCVCALLIYVYQRLGDSPWPERAPSGSAG